jgi:excisionase family DNA binding protein
MTIHPERIVLTVEEAAERLGVGRTLLYALVRSGDIESIAIGRLRRIPLDALDEFVSRLRAVARDHDTADRD